MLVIFRTPRRRARSATASASTTSSSTNIRTPTSRQYEWLKLLAEPRRNLCCVGDDDQSIYSWRGAEVANILRFDRDFPGAAVIRLEQNYRSTSHILAAADGLIAHNAGRLGKTLVDRQSATASKVKVIGVWDGPEEARRIGEEVEGYAAPRRVASTTSPSSSAPSSRPASSRSASSPSACPTRSSAASASTSAPRSATPLAYLRLIVQPADDLAFERIVNQPKRGLGDKAIATIHRHARATQAAAADRRRAPARHRRADPAGPPQPRPLRRRHRPLAAAWRTSFPTPELARILLDESGYTAMLQADRSAEAAGRLENLAELARAMEEYETPRRLPRACQPGHGQ